MDRHLILCACIATAAMASQAARAELPPLSPEQLRAQSSDIIEGKVIAVYSYDQPGTPEQTRRGAWVDTRSVAEILVTKVEKGKSFQPGQVGYVRFWRAKERPRGWAGPSGNHPPRVGGDFRVFASRGKDAGCDVLVPNGFEELKK